MSKVLPMILAAGLAPVESSELTLPGTKDPHLEISSHFKL